MTPRRLHHAIRPAALVAAALALCLAAPLAAQTAADSVIDRAVTAWAGVHTARGSFEQTITNALTGGTATSHGDFQQQRPNRLSIRFTDPDGDRIISDGKLVWLYLPSSAPDRVIKRSALAAGATPVDLTGQFLTAPRTKYQAAAHGTATVEGHATHAVVLTPRAGADVPFTRATVWVDDDDSLIRQFEVVEPSGVTRRVRLTTLAVNAPVDAAAFRYTPPRGVRVIDQTRAP